MISAESFNWFCALLRPGDVVIDVGANAGDLTRQYANMVSKAGHVIAVEADPVTARILAQNCADQSQVEVLARPLWSHLAVVDVFRSTDDSRQTTLFRANAFDPAHDLPFPAMTTTLDAVAAPFPRIKGVKIDAQGAEVHILRGAPAVLDSGAAFLVEVWPAGLKAAGASTEELCQIFRSRGYEPRNTNDAEILAEAQRMLDNVADILRASFDVLWERA